MFFNGGHNSSIHKLESSHGSIGSQIRPANLGGINYLTGDNRMAVDSKNPFKNLSRQSREEQASGESIVE